MAFWSLKHTKLNAIRVYIHNKNRTAVLLYIYNINVNGHAKIALTAIPKCHMTMKIRHEYDL